MTSYTNTFGGYTILPSEPSYSALSLTTNTTLSWPTESQNGVNILAKFMAVSPTAGSLTLRLPDATEGSPGWNTIVYNPTATTFTLANNGGGLVLSAVSGGVYLVTLTDNTTANGVWLALQLTTGPTTAAAAALAGYGLTAITTTLNQSMPGSILSTDYTVTANDRATALIWNGGAGVLTLPAGASLGTDWFCFVKGGGSGSLVVTPSGGELIDGQATIDVGTTGSTAIMFKSGAWYTISFVQNPTLGYTRVVVDVAGSGNFTLSASQYTNDLIYLQGVLAGNREVIFPATVAVYYVENATTGAYSLGVRTGSQSPAVALAQGARSIVQCDGTNMGVASTQLSFPAFAGNALKFLRLNAGETTLEFADVGGLVLDIRTAAAAITVNDLSQVVLATIGYGTQDFDSTTALGANFGVYFVNESNDGITLDPHSAQTIDGTASVVIPPDSWALIQGDGTALRTVAGNWREDRVFISVATATTAAAIDFVGLDSAFDEYVIEAYEVLPTAGGQQRLILRTSTSNGVSFDAGANNYDFAVILNNSDGVVGQSNSTGLTYIELAVDLGAHTANTIGWSGEIHIPQPWLAGRSPSIRFDAVMGNRDTNRVIQRMGVGRRLSQQPINAVRLQMLADEIRFRKAVLYGVRKRGG